MPMTAMTTGSLGYLHRPIVANIRIEPPYLLARPGEGGELPSHVAFELSPRQIVGDEEVGWLQRIALLDEGDRPAFGPATSWLHHPYDEQSVDIEAHG
jgi:hypothetical protein